MLRANAANSRVSVVVLLAIGFPMIAQTFQYYPVIGAVQEVWNILCFFYFVVFYLLGQMQRGWDVSKFELYLLSLIVVIPVLSALSAAGEFRQPLFYGLLSERSIMNAAAVLGIHSALRRRAITLQEVLTALLVVAWGNWFLNVTIRLLLSPGSFHGTPFVTGGGETESFALQSYFIIFGSLYYAFRGLRTRVNYNYALALALLAGSMGKTGGRAVLLSALAAFFFYLVRWERFSRVVLLVPAAVVMVALAVGALYLVQPDAVAERLGKFEQAITVALTGESVDDVSANARTQEVPFATAGIFKHPWFGNGRISNQFLGGGNAVQGQYFFPADVGVLGVLYLYGIAGCVLFAMQYVFLLKATAGLPKGAYTPLFDALRGALFYTALSSLANGTFVFAAGLTLVWIAILQACTRRIREVHALSAREPERAWKTRQVRRLAPQGALRLRGGTSPEGSVSFPRQPWHA